MTLAVSSMKMIFSSQPLGSLHDGSAPCRHCCSLQPLYLRQTQKSAQFLNMNY